MQQRAASDNSVIKWWTLLKPWKIKKKDAKLFKIFSKLHARTHERSKAALQ